MCIKLNDCFAFPHPCNEFQRGMTLRDYFAAQAIGTFILSVCDGRVSFTDASGIKSNAQAVAVAAYALADAMLAEREK